ncbi:DUF2017 family protein [Actinomyces bowdenii]|uniref:DUF2017 family protein n=1 Tax=Actinomyces bowdenii TaxID=131109 RepID=A0A3P1V6E8_9ACTO|nr:DUF2017 family protein [Actinomyces bowdenii]RRD29719.1 DUF2017 family protein [Actinomyces bowdenii]
MRAFTPAAQGLACAMEDWERELLAGLAMQVSSVLDAGAPRGTGPHQAGAGRPGESGRDREILEALDFQAPQWPQGGEGAGEASGGAAADPLERAPEELRPLLRVLLPEASQDPATARETASLTREPLRGEKQGRLEAMAAELARPSGPAGAVLVPRGQEGRWLGAINDIRLVLAQRLSIQTAQDAERVHRVALEEEGAGEGRADGGPGPGGVDDVDDPAHAQWLRGTALVYDLLTWWQESLVAAVLGASGPA